MDKRKLVSHLYSDGDICDLTGRPRQVEVRKIERSRNREIEK